MTYYRNYQDGGKVEPGFIKRWFADKYKASPDQIGGLASQIAMIESDDMNVPQSEGGPGRGYFQFETKKGSGAFQTALQRTKNIYTASGKRIPEWISAAKESDDATTLNREQQEELLLANFAENPRAKREMIMGALESGDAKDLWLQAHWAGKKEQYEEKSKYWDEKFQGMADGGDVRGQSTDTVPAMLTPGEFVIRKDAADKIGPEKLQMLNNIDRLSDTALLENAKSPMGYQKGGLVGMLGNFIKGQKENWARAKTMGEETGVRNPFLRTEEEQLAQMQGAGTMPRGGWLEKKMPQAYAAGNPELKGPSKKEYGVESFSEQPFMGVAATAEPKPEPEERKYSHDDQMKFKEHIRGMLGTDDVYEAMEGKYGVDIATEEFDIEGEEKTDWSKVLGKMTRLSMAEDEARKEALPDYYSYESGVYKGTPIFGESGEELLRDPLSGEMMPVSYWTDEFRERVSRDPKAHTAFKKEHGWKFPTIASTAEGYYGKDWKDLLEKSKAGFQQGGYINGYQNGGEVMNYQNGGQVKDVLSIFGEKSKSGDEMKSLMAMAAIQQMQRAQQVQQAQGGQGQFAPVKSWPGESEYAGLEYSEVPETPADKYEKFLQERETFKAGAMERAGAAKAANPDAPWWNKNEGGYIGGYQQGGAVEPPMSGPESGPQEAPLPGGDQTYHQPAMEQLDMDQYEYASYVEHGPDMYKWMAPKYKSKQQWAPYDAMVDAGIIDPYEIGKDEINVVTKDQIEALSNQAKESMRV
tara:strand:- start:128 stop:2389 length:2262 start_codon:yes stop_codon:yes gene_type:complete